jgi:SpoIID/LytB domain protein
MRVRALTLILTLLVAAGAAAAATPPRPPSTAPPSTTAKTGPVFVVTGGGWGHGVGMSQWGAYGQAKVGRTFDQILSYYYTGTELGDAPSAISKRLRVLIADNVPSVTLTSLVPFSVADATGARYPLPAGDLTVPPTLELPVGPNGELVSLLGPIQFRSGKGSPLKFRTMSYRGELRVSSNTKRLQLVDIVPLESYLLGVVPGEMPKDWPLEALKAQAVAARTYAIGNLLKGKPYDLYSDWRSQMYYGVEHEASGPTQAVRDTKGKVVTYQGKVAQVFYFSSSGGRTANAVDVYGNDVPYLVSVDDPWDVASPYHRWTPRQLTGLELAKAFGLAQPVVDVTYEPGFQGSPAQIVLTTAAGVSVPFRTTDVRARLALRSSTFKLGVLNLSPPVRPARPGVAVKVSGVARDVDGAVIERRVTGGTWASAAKVKPASDGTFTATLRPTTTTTYRLTATGVGGLAVTVKVAGPTT